MNDRVFADVSKKLDLIARLAALSLGSGKTQREHMSLLYRAGFAPKQIADLIGTTPNTVRVALSNMRRFMGRKRRMQS